MDVSRRSYAELDGALEAARKAGRPAVALLPAGACEQHGPHLPLRCDTAIARHVAREVDLRAEREKTFDAFLFPCIEYGPVRTGISFTGTVSVDPDVFRAHVDAVLRELLRNGFDAVAVVNGHGINTPSLLERAYELLDTQFRDGSPTRRPVLVIDTFKANAAVGARFGLDPGTHADWIECLLAMAAFGPEVFTKERLAAYREWAAKQTAPLPGFASIFGIPMEHRSYEGVRGRPLPPDGDWWQHAREAMEIVCEKAYATVRDDLASFRAKFGRGGRP